MLLGAAQPKQSAEPASRMMAMVQTQAGWRRHWRECPGGGHKADPVQNRKKSDNTDALLPFAW